MPQPRSAALALLAGLSCAFSSVFVTAAEPPTGRLYVGWATVDITPAQRVVLDGSGYKRVTKEVEDPVTATVLALETRDGDKPIEQAIMISLDLVRMTKEVHEGLQRVAAEKLKGFDSSKLICGVTHTHCGPSISYDKTGPGQLYDISQEKEVMTPQQYIQFLYQKVGAGMVQAWEGRKPGGYTWALGEAVIGYNRRLSYRDGSAIMGFDVSRQDFSHVEGYEGPWRGDTLLLECEPRVDRHAPQHRLSIAGRKTCHQRRFLAPDPRGAQGKIRPGHQRLCTVCGGR